MAGQIKYMLDAIIQQRAKGNPTIVQTTKCKLIFKGFNPDHFNSQSADDATAIAKLKAIAAELGVNL